MRSIWLGTVLGLLCTWGSTAAAKPASPVDSGEPPWLGVGLEPGGTRGVRILEVIEGTPAAAVGIQLGDEIVSVAGAEVKNDQELIDAIRLHRVGDTVEIGVLRRGRVYKVRPQLSASLDDSELLQRRIVDKPAPDFDLPIVEGTSSGKLESLQGQVVVLEFFQTWCMACKQTYGELARLQAEHPGDLVVLGISSETAEVLQRFLANYKLGFSVLRDPGATVQSSFQSRRFPTFVVIDRAGMVRYAGIGADLALDETIYAAERALKRRRF